MLILKDLERLQNGTAKMENFQAGGRWSSGVNPGHVDREEGKQFEAAKWRAQGRIVRGCEQVKRFAGNVEN